MKRNTLLVGEIHRDALKILEDNTRVTKINTETFLRAGKFPDVEAIVLRTFTPLKKAELDKLPQLKEVVICSVGTDNLDLELLKQRNIHLIHIPGTNANSVAEHTLYLLLSLLREDSKKPFAELKGKTVGIIGLGAIGKLVAKKLVGFEARLFAFDVIEQDLAVLKDLRVEMKDYDSVLKEADIVTIHVPLNKYTEKLVTVNSFAKMKKNCFFVNTSRAEVIDEIALLQAYRDSKFRGIALDVCSPQLKDELLKESLDSNNLMKKNVIITDHCAAQGEDSFREQCLKPVEEFVKFLKNN